MKKIYMALAFIFLFPQQGYTKAQCPAGKTQSECCAMDTRGARLTLAECNSNCTGTCSSTDAYYAGCYKCSTGLTKPVLEPVQEEVSKTVCAYSTSAACTAVAGHGTCTKDTSTSCYYPISCSSGYYQNTELTITFNGTSKAVPACTQCPENGTCNGTSVTCNSGYTLTSTNPGSTLALKGTKWCVASSNGIGSNTGIDTSDADSVSGACPSGLSKSADGCCCVK